jgi:EAL domain-containing protein (putative c-di-GMP-specific phosphodiesterase class I)
LSTGEPVILRDMHTTLAPGRLRTTDAELRCALTAGSLVVAYQPVVDLRVEQVVAVDAVLQWQHPDQGVLTGDAFLPRVEDPALLCALDGMVLAAAARQVAAWHRQGLVLELTVGVSPDLLVSPAFAQALEEVLRTSALDPRWLVLALPETALEGEEQRLHAALCAARALGVGLAVDRFGTGCSTVAQLRDNAVNAIRLDRDLIAGLGTDPDADGMAGTAASLGSLLGACSVAVGVEHLVQHRRILEAGFERAQGALYAAAVPAERLPAQVDRCEAGAAALAAAPAVGPVPEPVLATMTRMREGGASIQTIAAALNRMGSRHPSGRRWHGTSVGRELAAAARSVPAVR